MMDAEEVVVYASGPLRCSACVPEGLARGEIERRVSEANPAGIETSWRLSDEPAFADGVPNPVRCEQAAGRWHYLLRC